MGFELVTRAAKRIYDEKYLLDTNRQFFSKIFNVLDESTTASFMLDKLIGAPYAVTYRAKNGQSHVRPYTPGTGLQIEPPVASEKTPLTEELLDKLAAGVDVTSGFGANELAQVNEIVRDHISAHHMTKNKQALDVLRTGIFPANGPGGVDIGQKINLGRAAANSITADLTSISMTAALAAGIAQLHSKGTPLDNLVCVMGSSWLSDYGSDSDINGNKDNNSANLTLRTEMIPPELMGIEGLFIKAQYNGGDMLAPLFICSYAPPTAYVKDKGKTAEPFVPANAAIFFSLSDIRYRVNRGVNVIDGSGKRAREVGDLVIDRFSENDPVAEYIRSSTRHCLVPANINHTLVSVGTFS